MGGTSFTDELPLSIFLKNNLGYVFLIFFSIRAWKGLVFFIASKPRRQVCLAVFALTFALLVPPNQTIIFLILCCLVTPHFMARRCLAL